jgi:DNA-binding SARP family transcriptional activator
MQATHKAATTQLGILGPMYAVRDGMYASLGGPQQRIVLVLLVLAKGNRVSMAEFIDALWGAASPPSAVNVVRTYLKRLRKSLDPQHRSWQASNVLPSVGDGYALSTEDVDVDLWRFQDAVSEALQERRAGDHAAAARLLASALRLWRGDVASELPELTNHPLLFPVNAERWTAVDWYAEAALASGAAAEAIPIMESATIARPLDEFAHARLIALYHASGRRSDAARVFQGIQRRLRDELGLSPGPELSAAYSAVLQETGWSTSQRRQSVSV